MISSPTSHQEPMHDNFMLDARVFINVSGMPYETRLRTLAKFPETLLGSPRKRNLYYVQGLGEYFFNRNRSAFEAILFFYQSNGRLQRPADVPMSVFKQEVEFFELGEEVVKDMLEKEGYIEEKVKKLPSNDIQRKVWECFEYPYTSLAAKILAIFSMSMVIISVMITVIESLPSIEEDRIHYADKKLKNPWFIIELAFNIWFTFEYMVRLLSSPNKSKFVKSLLNIVDLAAVAPFFIMLTLDSSQTGPVAVVRVLRVVRVFRMFKLSRYSKSLNVIGYCVVESLHELGLLIVCLFIMVTVSSSLLFYIEVGEANSYFTSIPATFWFSIQTVTTIGYGDMIPVTALGKFTTAISAVFGAITLALPVLSFVSNFNSLYYKNVKENINEESTKTTVNCDNNNSTRSLDETETTQMILSPT